MGDIKKKSKFESVEDLLKTLTSGAIKLSIIILFSVIAWRIAWSSFSLDLSKFDFSDLLAMILALFAMIMSVAFYFKSTDSSNLFYDNIYNFTQKTSEILGRIEERFGERLKHIDEGYGRIESRFDGISNNSDEIEKKVKETEGKVKETEGKEEKEKEKLEEANKAMRKMIDTLAMRAKLQEKEKKEFYQNLEKLTSEKDSVQERIREIEEERDKMKQQLHIFEKDMERGLDDIRNPALEQILHHPHIRHLIKEDAPPKILQRHSREIFEDFPVERIEDLREEGIINKRLELTAAGLVMLRTMSRRFRR